MRYPLRAVLSTAVATSCLLAGCGPGTADDVAQIRHVITAFSAAGGPSACGYLTTGALNELFSANGHTTGERKRAIAACVAKSRSFKGAPIDIGRVWFPTDPRTATALAHSRDRSSRWQVYLHKVGGRWLIAHIQH